MNVYYLGPSGSYSHTLIQKLFPNEEAVPCRTFAEIVQYVQKDQKSYGLLGIENSISSSVHENIDLFFTHNLYIVGEACMNITLNLIGLEGATLPDIKTVYSYPQALSQCSGFIKKHAVKVIETTSTTAAVEEVDTLQNKTVGAIAGLESIVGTELVALKEHIGNDSHNMTRWVVISQEAHSRDEMTNKMTIIFKVKHEPGSLVRVLQAIADHAGNLSKIESRPVAGSNWEYEFWVDIEVPDGSAQVFENLMQNEALSFRVVGAYRKGKTF